MLCQSGSLNYQTNFLFLSSLYSTVKIPRPCDSNTAGRQQSGGESDSSPRSHSSDQLRLPHTTSQSPPHTDHPAEPLSSTCTDQDQPLCFDKNRLAVATAAFRGPLAKGSSSEGQNLAMVLQSKLPNLTNGPSERTLPDRSKEKNPDQVQSPPREPPAAHVLGLDYNSSSDDEGDA